jgi:TolA-binding protein
MKKVLMIFCVASLMFGVAATASAVPITCNMDIQRSIHGCNR